MRWRWGSESNRKLRKRGSASRSNSIAGLIRITSANECCFRGGVDCFAESVVSLEADVMTQTFCPVKLETMVVTPGAIAYCCVGRKVPVRTALIGTRNALAVFEGAESDVGRTLSIGGQPW